MFPVITKTFLLWLIGWLTPWPILLIIAWLIFWNKKSWMKKWVQCILVAAWIEMLIWLFLISFSSIITIPVVVFSYLAIVWWCMLLYIAYKIKDVSFEWLDNDSSNIISLKEVALFMFLNWPMWLFWLTVCLPIAKELQWVISYWEYVFIAVFQIAMIAGMCWILLWLSFFKNLFTNKLYIKRLFVILSLLLVIFWVQQIHNWIIWIL